MKYVTYWYEFFTRCEELVPVFHSVKFAKCEICDSTEHTLPLNSFFTDSILSNGEVIYHCSSYINFSLNRSQGPEERLIPFL